ncbi:N-terminal acetyltransferase [Actinomortierella ambigua]|nr:N-terminal acetyltransferase [Actinomortierella ambigua]
MSVREEDKRLTREQTLKVLHHIGFPLEQPDQLPPPTFDTLTELQYRCVITIPFETLALRMTPERHINITLDGILDRVLNKKRGGFCMSNNRLLYELVIALGFQAQWVLGRACFTDRVGSPPMYRFSDHRVTIVMFRGEEGGQGVGDSNTINNNNNNNSNNRRNGGGKKYMVDIGWGNSFFEPIELRVGAEIEYFGHRRRMKQVIHPDSRSAAIGNPEELLWLTERYMSEREHEGQENPWVPLFVFSERQSYEVDVEMTNWYLCHSPNSSFLQRFWCIRGTADGKYLILMQDQFRIRSSLGTEKTIVCATEEQREQVLAEYFGIVLTEEERACNDQKLESDYGDRG